MARPQKPVDPAGGVAAQFASQLRELRARAGNPTYRDMARSARCSASVLSSAASGARLPTLQVTLGFVAACGGDREEWRRRWMRVARVTEPGFSARDRHRTGPSDPMPRPAQLPPHPCGFACRRTDLDQLHAPAGAPVVIIGPVGVGKSDLALHYAHRAAGELVDGQLYADLGHVRGAAPDPGYVLEGFLRALGVPADQLPRTLDQRAGLYRSLLAERRLLVLLDGVRDERQVRPLLGESRRSVTLVVSRTPLLGLDDVRRVRLAALPRARSIAMIAAAVPERAWAEPYECERIAELCGDLPLALSIALRKLDARPDLPLRRASATLLDRERALDWLCIGDLSLRKSLHSVYQEISGAARNLLARIARIPFCCDPDSITQDGCELAEELVDAGLLRRGDQPGTYRVEWLVRAFVLAAGSHPDAWRPPPRIERTVAAPARHTAERCRHPAGHTRAAPEQLDNGRRSGRRRSTDPHRTST